MKIGDEDWADIVSMTKAACLTWQMQAEAKGCRDQFTCHTSTKEGKTALLTKHSIDGQEVKAKCIIRFDDTGSVFPCKFDRKKRKWLAKPAPNSWIKAQGQPTETIWKKLGLTDFTMIIDSTFGERVAAPEMRTA